MQREKFTYQNFINKQQVINLSFPPFLVALIQALALLS